MRIAYFTDTHLSGLHRNSSVRPRWRADPALLFDQLLLQWRKWRPDLVIVGGDIIHSGGADQIRAAVHLLSRIDAPTLLSPGNHDLAVASNADDWPRLLRAWPQAIWGDYALLGADCDVMCLTNYWLSSEGAHKHFRARDYLGPWLVDPQLEWLRFELSRRSDRPALLAVHAPVALPDPRAAYSAAYGRALRGLVCEFPRLRLVLSGHIHKSTIWEIAPTGCREATTSSLTEAPFSWRSIEVLHGRIAIRTHFLANASDISMAPYREFVPPDGAPGLSDDFE